MVGLFFGWSFVVGCFCIDVGCVLVVLLVLADGLTGDFTFEVTS